MNTNLTQPPCRQTAARSAPDDLPRPAGVDTPAQATPILLFGMERSGTTLLSMMVGAHPQIAVPLSVTGMWYEFFAALEAGYDDLADASDVTRLVDDVLSHERIRLWNAALDRDRILANCRTHDFGSVVAAVHGEYARRQGKPYWANIDIRTLDAMHVSNGWFPDGRFVHIIRDGRDVALSHQTMPYGAGNIAECALAWDRRVGQNLRIGAVLGPGRYLAIRYEDLILEPEAILRRICDFLVVPYSPSMLNYRQTVEKTIPPDKRWLWPEIAKPPQRSRVAVWKSHMSATQRTVFEWNAGDLLRELHYEAGVGPGRHPMAHLLELWYFLGRGGRWYRLRKKLGFSNASQLEKQAGVR